MFFERNYSVGRWTTVLPKQCNFGEILVELLWEHILFPIDTTMQNPRKMDLLKKVNNMNLLFFS